MQTGIRIIQDPLNGGRYQAQARKADGEPWGDIGDGKETWKEASAILDEHAKEWNQDAVMRIELRKYLTTGDGTVSIQSIRSLEAWANDRGGEPLKDAVVALTGALQRGKTVTITIS